MGRGRKPKPYEVFVEPREDGCWWWIGNLDTHGYGIFRKKLAHREAFRRANGSIPAGMLVCHSCDNRACVNPKHLWLGTNADNMADMWAKGRGKTKLNECQVKEIRELHGKVPQKELADRFGVALGSIANIQAGRIWKRVA